MTRKIDELGRIVLPAEIRKELNVGTNCEMRIEFRDGSIVLTPTECFCTNCKTIIPAGTKYNLCENCITAIRKDG